MIIIDKLTNEVLLTDDDPATAVEDGVRSTHGGLIKWENTSTIGIIPARSEMIDKTKPSIDLVKLYTDNYGTAEDANGNEWTITAGDAIYQMSEVAFEESVVIVVASLTMDCTHRTSTIRLVNDDCDEMAAHEMMYVPLVAIDQNSFEILYPIVKFKVDKLINEIKRAMRETAIQLIGE